MMESQKQSPEVTKNDKFKRRSKIINMEMQEVIPPRPYEMPDTTNRFYKVEVYIRGCK